MSPEVVAPQIGSEDIKCEKTATENRQIRLVPLGWAPTGHEEIKFVIKRRNLPEQLTVASWRGLEGKMRGQEQQPQTAGGEGHTQESSAWSMGTREAGSVLQVTFSSLGFSKDMVFSRRNSPFPLCQFGHTLACKSSHDSHPGRDCPEQLERGCLEH